MPQKVIKGQALVDFLADHRVPNNWELSDDLPGRRCSALMSFHLGKCTSMSLPDMMGQE